MQRRLLRRALREMDDEAVGLAYWHFIYNAWQSQVRADLAELARIKAAAASVQAIPADHIVTSTSARRPSKRN